MNKTFVLRALVSGAITLAILGFTSALGVWQYSQSQRDDIQQEVLGASPVPLTAIHAPEEFVQENVFGRRVTLEGTLDCEKSLELTSRTIVGDLCLFKNANALPIVVFLSEALTIDTVDKDIGLIGRLQPVQSYEPVSVIASGENSMTEINIHALVQHYQQSIYDGFVVVESIQSDAGQQDWMLDESLLILPPAGIEFRNLFYAWQWWIFAGFALLLWVKYVRDEWQKNQDAM